MAGCTIGGRHRGQRNEDPRALTTEEDAINSVVQAGWDRRSW
jgi:hypothetical protein